MGIFKIVASKSPPRSSSMGIMETKNTAISGVKKEGMFSANQCTTDSINNLLSV